MGRRLRNSRPPPRTARSPLRTRRLSLPECSRNLVRKRLGEIGQNRSLLRTHENLDRHARPDLCPLEPCELAVQDGDAKRIIVLPRSLIDGEIGRYAGHFALDLRRGPLIEGRETQPSALPGVHLLDILRSHPRLYRQAIRGRHDQHQGFARRGDAAMLCAVALIALSGSRGGAISVGLLLLMLLFFRPARKWAVGGVAVILCLFLFAPFLFDTLIQRAIEGEGGELGGRPILWEASLLFMRDHLLGAGIGNGPFRLHPYIASLTSATNHRMDLPSHQPFLEVGVDTGLVGLIIYVCVIGSAIWSFVQSRSRWLLSPSCPDGYYLTVIGVAAAYGATWIKGGGLENHTSLIVMFALLLIPSLVQEADDRSARERGPWPSKHRHDRG